MSLDPAKRATWPQVVVATRNYWKCEVALFVIAPGPKVARWCWARMRFPGGN